VLKIPNFISESIQSLISTHSCESIAKSEAENGFTEHNIPFNKILELYNLILSGGVQSEKNSNSFEELKTELIPLFNKDTSEESDEIISEEVFYYFKDNLKEEKTIPYKTEPLKTNAVNDIPVVYNNDPIKENMKPYQDTSFNTLSNFRNISVLHRIINAPDTSFKDNDSQNIIKTKNMQYDRLDDKTGKFYPLNMHIEDTELNIPEQRDNISNANEKSFSLKNFPFTQNTNSDLSDNSINIQNNESIKDFKPFISKNSDNHLNTKEEHVKGLPESEKSNVDMLFDNRNNIVYDLKKAYEIKQNDSSITKINSFSDETDIKKDTRLISEFVAPETQEAAVSADNINSRDGLVRMNNNENNSTLIQNNELLDRIVERIGMSSKDGRNIIEMSILKDDLGIIEIETVIKDKSIRLGILTEKSETNRLLNAKVEDLNIMLSEKGFKVEQISISEKSAFNFTQSDSFANGSGFSERQFNQQSAFHHSTVLTDKDAPLKEQEIAASHVLNNSINIYI
jgi:hypothetical protein